MPHPPSIRRASATNGSAAEMAAELRRQLDMPGLCLVVVYTSLADGLDQLAAELTRAFGPVPVIGCTTAGEIDVGGYRVG
ncbi:MAG TPA: FIST N-terminal domain-containing protein, partial [Magnetospirillum sp.]|nr:FIST N-terminal domain-containing protein [Magnetospirillum sp.]